MIGNLVALANLESSQLDSLKQPLIESLFNLLEVCRQRQTFDEQPGRPNHVTSVWHPIIGHVRGKTTAHTVSVKRTLPPCTASRRILF